MLKLKLISLLVLLFLFSFNTYADQSNQSNSSTPKKCVSLMSESTNSIKEESSVKETSSFSEINKDYILQTIEKIRILCRELQIGVLQNKSSITQEDARILSSIYAGIYFQLSAGNGRLFHLLDKLRWDNFTEERKEEFVKKFEQAYYIIVDLFFNKTTNSFNEKTPHTWSILFDYLASKESSIIRGKTVIFENIYFPYNSFLPEGPLLASSLKWKTGKNNFSLQDKKIKDTVVKFLRDKSMIDFNLNSQLTDLFCYWFYNLVELNIKNMDQKSSYDFFYKTLLGSNKNRRYSPMRYIYRFNLLSNFLNKDEYKKELKKSLFKNSFILRLSQYFWFIDQNELKKINPLKPTTPTLDSYPELSQILEDIKVQINKQDQLNFSKIYKTINKNSYFYTLTETQENVVSLGESSDLFNLILSVFSWHSLNHSKYPSNYDFVVEDIYGIYSKLSSEDKISFCWFFSRYGFLLSKETLSLLGLAILFDLQTNKIASSTSDIIVGFFTNETVFDQSNPQDLESLILSELKFYDIGETLAVVNGDGVKPDIALLRSSNRINYFFSDSSFIKREYPQLKLKDIAPQFSSKLSSYLSYFNWYKKK